MVAILVIVLILVFVSIRQVQEYQRGILFVKGKFSRILEP